ncbi:MAG: HTH domain-containing protein [Corynebacterium sp.]|nr:HTH domain-containing protein [Corynebacterium sp.]
MAQFQVTFEHSDPALQPDTGVSERFTELLRIHGDLTAREFAELTGLSTRTVRDRLTSLMEAGAVIAEGATHSPKRTYRLS